MKKFDLALLLMLCLLTLAALSACKKDETPASDDNVQKSDLDQPKTNDVAETKDAPKTDEPKEAAAPAEPESDNGGYKLVLTINGKKVHAYNVPPQITDEEQMECADECGTTIKFSDASIADAYVKMSLDLMLENLGDLDGDGNDEIGCYPKWWTSVWHAYHFLTYKNGKWSNFIDSVDINTDYYSETPYKVIEKIADKPGWFITRSAETDDEGEFRIVENQVQAK